MFAIICSAFPAPPARAIKVAPLSYNIQLTSGQTKKGFVDITNTDQATATFMFSVQAFKQVNAAGDLQFFNDERMTAGIKLDYASFELAPRQTLRLAFLADSTKLPSGDSFAAIFAQAVPRGESAGTTGARVGTIVTIQNGTPAEHHAEITGLTVPFIQLSSALKGSYTIKNTSDPTKSAGFLPQVELTIDPLHQYARNQSSLVFAGIERPNTFSVPTQRFGFYRLTAAFGDSKKTAWVFVATPMALFVFTAVAGLAIFLAIALIKMYQSPNRGVRRRTKRHIPTRD